MRVPFPRALLTLLSSSALIVPLLGGAFLAPMTAEASGATVIAPVQVNMQAPAPTGSNQDNFPQNKQNEPSIVQDPLTGAFVAGSNDEIDEPLCTGDGTAASPGSCPFALGVGNSGVYLSSDGSSWTQPAYTDQCGATIHTLPGYCQVGLESFGDPVLTVGPTYENGTFSTTSETIYYGNLAVPRNGAASTAVVAVSRSMDDGHTWLAPTIASSSLNPVDFNDKDYVWADNNPASPYFGYVYASWTLFQGAGAFGRSNTYAPEPIVVARSTDGGQTWSMLTRLTSSGNNGAAGGRQGSEIRTGPDGSVYVFWEGAVKRHSEIQFAVSHNGGRTFSRPMSVAAVNDIPSPLPGTSFRTDSFPAVDVNQSTGAIDVAWADWSASSDTAFIKFTESTDGGASWSPPIVVGGKAGVANAYFPWIADSPDGTHVFVGWPAITWVAPGTAPGAGVVSEFVAYNLRTGDTWSGPAKLATSGDPDGSSTNALSAQFMGDYSTAIANNSAAYFVWTDTTNATPCPAVDAYRAAPSGVAPNPDLSCPGFGNTDIYVGGVSY